MGFVLIVLDTSVFVSALRNVTEASFYLLILVGKNDLVLELAVKTRNNHIITFKK